MPRPKDNPDARLTIGYSIYCLPRSGLVQPMLPTQVLHRDPPARWADGHGVHLARADQAHAILHMNNQVQSAHIFVTRKCAARMWWCI